MVATPRSFEMIAMLIVGGEGTLVGGLAGTALLTLLPIAFQPIALYKTVVEGAVLVLAFQYLPDGIVGGAWRLIGRVARTPQPRALMQEAAPAPDRPQEPHRKAVATSTPASNARCADRIGDALEIDEARRRQEKQRGQRRLRRIAGERRERDLRYLSAGGLDGVELPH